jgi:hypothetical protein
MRQRQGERDLEFLMPNRLGQIGRKTDRVEMGGVRLQAQGGQHHHPGGGQPLICLDNPAQAFPVHARHLHVDHGNAAGVVLVQCLMEGLERAGAICRLPVAHAPRGQSGGQNFAVGGVIVHDQYPHAL